jgi:hypothetical protein
MADDLSMSVVYNGRMKLDSWGPSGSPSFYLNSEVDAVDLSVVKGMGNSARVLRSFGSVSMPEPPDDTPPPTAKSSKRTRHAACMGGVCKVTSEFTWLKREGRWKRASASIKLTLDDAPEGSQLASVRLALVEQARVKALASQIASSERDVESGTLHASDIRERIEKLEEKLRGLRESLPGAETSVRDAAERLEGLRDDQRAAQGRLDAALASFVQP